MKSTARLFLVALPLLCTPFALAQHQTLTVNPATSTVAFTLASNHDTTTGTFHVDKGTVDFDRSSPKLSGLIVSRVRAIDGVAATETLVTTSL